MSECDACTQGLKVAPRFHGLDCPKRKKVKHSTKPRYDSMDLMLQLKNVRSRKRKAIAKVLVVAQHRLAVWALATLPMLTRRDDATISDLANDVHGEAQRAVAALSKLVDEERRISFELDRLESGS